MRLEKCYFCSATCYPGHGISFVRNDGKMFRFCRSKCHKNFKLKRNPRRIKWTKAHRMAAGKEMVLDTTFEFEKRRNILARYNRAHMETTVNAMNIVEQVKTKRSHQFHVDRLNTLVGKEDEKIRASIQKHVHLVDTPLLDKHGHQRTEIQHHAMQIESNQ